MPSCLFPLHIIKINPTGYLFHEKKISPEGKSLAPIMDGHHHDEQSTIKGVELLLIFSVAMFAG